MSHGYNEPVFKKNLIFVVIGGVLFLGLIYLFNRPKMLLQYNSAGNLEPIGNVEGEATESAVAEDQFARWSIFENEAARYRFAYPAGFKINSDFDNKVEVFPPSGPGRIIIYFKDNNMEFKVALEEKNTKQKRLFQSTEKLIRETFEVF